MRAKHIRSGNSKFSFLVNVFPPQLYKMVCAGGGQSWTVSRRYRQFQYLHNRLLHLGITPPSLPPKLYLVSSLKKERIQKRMQQLQTYLNKLLMIDGVLHSEEFWGFLAVGENVLYPSLLVVISPFPSVWASLHLSWKGN